MTTATSTPTASRPQMPADVAAALAPRPLTDDDRQLIGRLRDAHREILTQLRKKIVGQDEILEQLMICFFSSGHALLVGVPGLAKTLMVKSLAEVLNLGFNRIQFTPDLMPSDITGAEVIGEDQEKGERGFRFLSGPIFNNMILADEINRTPPKTMAALLEAMEEFTVHVGGKRYEMPKPFFVLATQNPIEQEGTYTLPAAALDRFMMNIFVDYPAEATETAIVEMTTSREEVELPVVLSKDDIERVLQISRKLPVSERIVNYAVDIVRHTRTDESPLPAVREYVAWGASPRATQALLFGAKVRAMLYGREEVKAEDLRAIALPVLRHRVMCNFHAESEGVNVDDLIRHILDACPRPDGGGSAGGGSTPLLYRPTAEHATDSAMPAPRSGVLGTFLMLTVLAVLPGLFGAMLPRAVTQTIANGWAPAAADSWWGMTSGFGAVCSLALVASLVVSMMGVGLQRLLPGVLVGLGLVAAAAAAIDLTSVQAATSAIADAGDTAATAVSIGGAQILGMASGFALVLLGMIGLAIRDWHRYTALAATLPEGARATLRPPGGLVAWLWGPETRREDERRARAKMVTQAPRIEQLMARDRSARKRLSFDDLWVLAAVAFGVLLMALNALWVHSGAESVALLAGVDATSAWVATVINGLFAVLGLVAIGGIATRQEFGRTVAVVMFSLLALTELFVFMFSQGQLHPSISTPHMAISSWFGTEFGKGTDIAPLLIIGFCVVCLVKVFWRRED